MNDNNYIRRKSNKQENRTAKDFGGKTRPGSGNMEFAKGDVRSGVTTAAFNVSDFLVENKYTDAPAYKLTTATWRKIEREALRENMRTPMMQIDVQDVQLAVLSQDDFIALGLWDLCKSPSVTIQDMETKSIALRASFFEPIFEAELNYYLPVRFPKENLHLVVMGYDDFKRIMF